MTEQEKAMMIECISLIDSKQSTIEIEGKKFNLTRPGMSKKIKRFRKENRDLYPLNPGQPEDTEEIEDTEENITESQTNQEIATTQEVIEKHDEEVLKVKEKESNAKKEEAKAKAEAIKLAEKSEPEKVTFTIPKDLIRAIRRKSSNEDLKIIDMVKEALYGIPESKYFKKY